MFAHRMRRWPNIKPALAQSVLFAEPGVDGYLDYGAGCRYVHNGATQWPCILFSVIRPLNPVIFVLIISSAPESGARENQLVLCPEFLKTKCIIMRRDYVL